ncbi:MAG: excinuclease ABC subunit UvrA [bacterium]|nr:excinuclease ABC subunit UvrA [bacterium]
MKNNIKVSGAKVHNLKDISLTIPKNKLIVFTGLSGSGKSSLAFDTIYAEGQRRYIESLSAYARQFLGKLDKPDVDRIDGLSPAISIDQKSASHNPRSTVGTITEIYDYLRLLFASIGEPHCHQCGKRVQTQSSQEIIDLIMKFHEGTKLFIMAPVFRNKKGQHKDIIEKIRQDGFSRIRIDKKIEKLSDEIIIEKNRKHSIEIIVDRVVVNNENKARISESIETCLLHSKGQVLIEEVDTGKELLFSEMFACTDCNISFSEISHRLFSFNSPIGACKDCNGLGDKMDFDPDLIIENPDNPIRHSTGKIMNLDGTYQGASVERTGRRHGFNLDTPYKDLSEKQKNILLYGVEESIKDNPFITGYNIPVYDGVFGRWEGVITNLRRRYFQTQSDGMRFFFRNYMVAKKCTACQGKRLKKEALSVKVQGSNIADMTSMDIKELYDYFDKLKLKKSEKEVSGQILKEITERLSFLKKVGLDYLTLDRKSHTLSGGEYQRIRLSTQIGSGLTGVLYVLDEPSIGLHQRDNNRLIEALKRLRDLGNTLIVVEHDEDMITSADHIVDIGPLAGRHGGQIVFSGNLDDLLKDSSSLTASYLSGREKIELPSRRRPLEKRKLLKLTGAAENNLKNIDVTFPLGTLICVTGVSGSGKSSLIQEILHKALMRHFYKSRDFPGKYESLDGLKNIDKVITIDQSAIGRTPRSNPATYTGVFGPVRDIFAMTKEAKIKGYKPGRFSFNVKGGRCDCCEGDGVIKIEMHFLADVYITCDLCKGRRYNEQTLEVKYKGYTISDVLNMTVNEAYDVFENIPQIASKLKTLKDVGMGYIHLGQNATTLSGGEAQRVKLSKELGKRSTGKTLYLLDEPTTGLHFEDIRKLLLVLNRLVDSGNTVVVIEHNLDVIKTADYIIDLGPDGGSAGGQIVAAGTPEDIVRNKKSYTGKYLKKFIENRF